MPADAALFNEQPGIGMNSRANQGTQDAMKISTGAASRLRTLLKGSKDWLHHTEHPAACPPLTVFPVNQGWLRSFSLSPTHFVFGQGCDRAAVLTL
jgi:hypothetical protein